MSGEELKAKVGQPLWFIAVLGAFMVSIEVGVATVLGLASQWAKAQVRWNTALVMVLSVVVCVGVYAAFHPPADMIITDAWVKLALAWASATLGLGSFAGSTGGAPKTDSRH